ncbi:unnamed protein product, partial [Ectocarpus fasciculatus]
RAPGLGREFRARRGCCDSISVDFNMPSTDRGLAPNRACAVELASRSNPLVPSFANVCMILQDPLLLGINGPHRRSCCRSWPMVFLRLLLESTSALARNDTTSTPSPRPGPRVICRCRKSFRLIEASDLLCALPSAVCPVPFPLPPVPLALRARFVCVSFVSASLLPALCSRSPPRVVFVFPTITPKTNIY